VPASGDPRGGHSVRGAKVNAPNRILLIGDSISMGYTPHVAVLLAGRADVVHNPGNAGDTDHTRADLDAWLAELPAEVVHFNCGLHDIKVARPGGANQVPLPRYRENLTWIVQRLQATGAGLVWASSTPVIETRHQAVKDFDRYNRDVESYNLAAAEIMAEAGVPVDDLHAVAAAADLQSFLTPDGVHFTEAGYGLLASAVAEALSRVL